MGSMSSRFLRGSSGEAPPPSVYGAQDAGKHEIEAAAPERAGASALASHRPIRLMAAEDEAIFAPSLPDRSGVHVLLLGPTERTSSDIHR